MDFYIFGLCTKLTSVTIPNSVKTMGPNMFYGCSSLKTVVLGSGLTDIGAYMFRNCPNLTNVTCLAFTPPTIDGDPCYGNGGLYNTVSLKVPVQSKSSYKNANYWGSFTKYTNDTYDFTENNLRYVITSNTTVKALGPAISSPSGIWEVPATANGFTVTELGAEAFRNCTAITELTLPKGLKTIGNWAMSGCTGLTSIVIPNSVTSVGYSVLMDCKNLKNVTIGSGLKVLNEFMFIRCTGLEQITIPNTVTDIAESVFQGCTSLKTVDIGTGVKSIARLAFTGCSALKTVYCHAVTPPTLNSSAFDTNAYTNAKLYVPYLSLNAYKSATNWKNFATINTTYDFAVNGIYYSKTSSNTVKVTYKDENYDSYTGYVTIPSNVTFDGTTYKVTAIGSYAFKGVNEGGHLTGVTIPSSVTTIEHDAFWLQQNLGNVTIPSSVTTIGDYAFCWCSSMTAITIPNSVTSMGSYVFAQCKKLATVNLGTGLTKISDKTFSGCEKLTAITLPDKITSIGASAFENCSSLKKVTMGSGMKSIGSYAFNGCDNLTSVTVMSATPPTMSSSYCFTTTAYSNATLWVPAAVMNAYKSADWWRMFTKVNALSFDFCVDGIYYKKTSSSTVEVTYKDTDYNTYSGTVNIPSSIKVGSTTYKVTAIGNNAFYRCTALTTVNMPSSVTRIGNYAFCSVSSMKSIVIGSGVKKIENLAFNSCTSLQTVTLPEGLEYISNQAFAYCLALKSVTIPNTVTKIDFWAFDQCKSLTTVVLGTGLKQLGHGAFSQSDALISVTCKAVVPPTMADSECFSQTVYSKAKLTVPQRSLSAYKSADWWRMFNSIVGGDFGGDPNDVNGDGEVSVADVNAAINAVLSGSKDARYDANGDGEVTVADINTIIEAVLKS